MLKIESRLTRYFVRELRSLRASGRSTEEAIVEAGDKTREMANRAIKTGLRDGL